MKATTSEAKVSVRAASVPWLERDSKKTPRHATSTLLGSGSSSLGSTTVPRYEGPADQERPTTSGSWCSVSLLRIQGWGYTKIRDALRGLKIEIGRTTVANILAEAGIEPAPERNRERTWKHFLRSHWETLYACDFFAVETLGLFGTVRHMVLFVIELKSRAVQIGGHPHRSGQRLDAAGRSQSTRCCGRVLRNATHLIHDRDPLFTETGTALLKSSGVKCVPIPAHSPNCNPHAERFVKTMRTECLEHFVIFGERHLRYLVGSFVDHYLTDRFHQGLGGQLIRPSAARHKYDPEWADAPLPRGTCTRSAPNQHDVP